MNLNSTPPEGLCARVAASGGESEARDPEAANAPQAGVQGVDPRALILDTITTAINQAGFWLAIEGRRAIADAVLDQAGKDWAAASRVRDLHRQYRFAGDDTTDYCTHCNQIGAGWVAWPCPTVAALDEQPPTA